MTDDFMMKGEIKRRFAMARSDKRLNGFKLKFQFLYQELRFQARLKMSAMALAMYYCKQELTLINEK